MIADIWTKDEFENYIVSAEYRDEFDDYAEAQTAIEEKMNDFLCLFPRLESDNETVRVYRVVDKQFNRESPDTVVGQSWVLGFENVDKTPYYSETNTNQLIMYIDLPVADSTYIAFDNVIDDIVEVVIPNPHKKYKIGYLIDSELNANIPN